MVSCEKVQDEPVGMPVCSHLVPIKFPCVKCYDESINGRLDELERYKSLIESMVRDRTDIYDFINEQKFRIDALESFEAEWRSMPKFDLHTWQMQQEEKIEKMDTSLKYTQQDLRDCCAIVEKIAEFLKSLNQNKPYTCPCCDGLGTRFPYDCTCVACEGKGVLWK